MRDVFRFKCPLGVLGAIADPFIKLHLRKFLETRNQAIKQVAEGDDWASLLKV